MLPGWKAVSIQSVQHLLDGLRQRLRSPAVTISDVRPGDGLLPGYVVLGFYRPGVSLDGRLELLIAQLSAELSACRWCIEQGRHRWRKALLPIAQLRQLRSYQTSSLFSERDRAALMLTKAVARYTERLGATADQAVAQARHHFTEAELARIAQIAAGEHFYDPVTGAVGQDVQELDCKRVMPRGAIAPEIGLRGLR